MTFPEIFENFKSHSYIRRESWRKDIFIQLRHSAKSIRIVNFEKGKNIKNLNNDTQLTTEDLLADDWIDIDDLMPTEPVKPTTFWDYVDTLEDGSTEWRIAISLGSKYYKTGKNPDEYLEEIIEKVNQK